MSSWKFSLSVLTFAISQAALAAPTAIMAPDLDTLDPLWNRWFDCAEEQIRVESLEGDSYTAEDLINRGLSRCASEELAYKKAVAAKLTTFEPAESARMAQDLAIKLRTSYISVKKPRVEQTLSNPAWGDAKVKIATLKWSRCIDTAADRLSSVSDAAGDVAVAVLANCRPEQDKAFSAFRHTFPVPVNIARTKLEDAFVGGEGKLLTAARERAITRIIEKRAGRK